LINFPPTVTDTRVAHASQNYACPPSTSAKPKKNLKM